MVNIEKLIKLLKAEREIFLEVEALTNQMMTSPTEELSDLLSERGSLLQKAVSIEDEINEEVIDSEDIRNVLRNRGDMSKLSDDSAAVYDASMSVKAVINRINRLEDDVRSRIENERNAILKKIESINSSSNSVAENYKRSVQTGFPQLTLFDKEKTI